MTQILLAEDNPGDVLLIQRALQEHGIEHTLYVVKDGAEALAYLAQIGTPGTLPCPDLLLLDLNLPKVDGPQVLIRFRQHKDCVQTPVIVVSSSNAEREQARLAPLGIARYFRKPNDLADFLQLGALVREVIEPEYGT